MSEISVEQSIWINASRERVWRAITDPKEITQWFSPEAPWELNKLEVGEELLWHSGEGQTERHIIVRLEPPHIIAYRWEPEPPDKPRVSTYELQEEDGGTRVTVLESGFEMLAEEDRQPQMEATVKGYAEVLEGLKELVESKHGE